MKLQWLISLIVGLLIMLSTAMVTARRINLRPLTGKEVYKILKEADREDAIPEGRIVTQGIAAISGFALGIKKGIAIPLAIGAATSNATQEFFNNLNYTSLTSNLPTFTIPTFNFTTLTSNIPVINVSSFTSSMPTINMDTLTNIFKKPTTSVQYTTQEICFDSRALNEIDDGEETVDVDDDDDYVDYGDDGVVGLGRQATTTSITNPTTGTLTLPTTTGTTDGTVTITADGDGTVSNTATTTQTDPGAVNCIVIQKPVVV